MGIQKRIIDPRPMVVADFVFCLDCSCSMLHVLDSIKENIVKFMEETRQMEDKYFYLDLRARVMGYRNFEVDEEYLLNDNPFVASVEELKKQLNGIVAKGYAENEHCSTLDAIWYAVKKSKWRDGCVKFIFVFTDAPTKPINEKTLADIIISAENDLSDTLGRDHVELFLWGLEDSVYDSLRRIPRANIIQFKDPIEFYYHKAIEFNVVSAIHSIGQVERYIDYLYMSESGECL